MICECLEDKMGERNVDNEGIVGEGLEGSKYSIRIVHVIFWIKNHYSETFALLEQLMLVRWSWEISSD